MTDTFVLVHAPSVGPSTWSWVADELEDLGYGALVPCLTGVQDDSENPFRHCVEAAVAAIPTDQEVVLVGHSGSGVLLPFIGHELSVSPQAHIFVDAGLPPVSGAVMLAEQEFRSFLDSIVHDDGMLPPWSQWWGDTALQTMVPDSTRRTIVEADVPRLPMRYYDQFAQVPPDWTRIPGGFLLFSDGYRNAADQARSWGWPVRELPAKHLHMVADSSAVAAAIVELTISLAESRTR